MKTTHLEQPARRRLLTGAAGLGVAALGAPALAATSAAARPLLPLTAQTTEGPYYFDPGLTRADITEGLPGVPLEVRFAVTDSKGAPCAGLRLDIWHCDATGLYSGYAGQGEDRSVSTKGKTFLRGTQAADKEGVAAFRSIYPGWYEGRATHIHFKVFNGKRHVLTSQFFLPDALSEYLYTQLPAYHRARLRSVLNSNDGIALQAGSTVVGAVRQEADRYVATLNVVVDPGKQAAVDRPPQFGEGPPSDAAAAANARGPQGAGAPDGRPGMQGSEEMDDEDDEFFPGMMESLGGPPPMGAGGPGPRPGFAGGPPPGLAGGPPPGFPGGPPPAFAGGPPPGFPGLPPGLAELEGQARLAALIPGLPQP
jgi:protocatechuate 3,4-dioxygenase beta subunit